VRALMTIFREVRDPRDLNARHDCASMLFVALMATLCGAKNCVDIADFTAANEGILAEIVDLPHGAPSRLCRLLDPDEMSKAFAAFTAALREALGLGPVAGVVAVDGKRLRRGYERGGKFMPPLMISVWDAQKPGAGSSRGRCGARIRVMRSATDGVAPRGALGASRARGR
jgi:DDE_Tnp_1-associated